ncbi:holo-ACP synthase [Desulforhabdus amnigena]|jgi:holo-[acyl-carrier protein] synthase|uniref:Holo-[acyl-carrier-protein] synthase n=1 Tax=Desulforhabdus amnigena TaxID=40218 RepID=A0A9W6FUJ0_9BACT|nr:holo-ACP synthase [Desulforhabdus amnigena]NLJ27593.1 holo-ACP synthase [Deltaproteobacteria bacterium]GLI35118.1 holo-[acyl-carrier-protein] synthase [Desulforhabdus amnigena]
MAIYGIGIDLVRTDRIQKMLDRWDARFLRRIFTAEESEVCFGRKIPARCFAMRFAAKEAFVKALGIGMRSPVLWLDIGVKSNALGKPEIVLSDRALRFCREKGIHAWHLSLTDDGDYGAAVVILES